MKLREQEVGLRQLADGRWQLDYIHPNGKRTRPLFATKRIALQEKRDIETAIADGRDPAGLSARVADVAARYLATYRGKERGEGWSRAGCGTTCSHAGVTCWSPR